MDGRTKDMTVMEYNIPFPSEVVPHQPRVHSRTRHEEQAVVGGLEGDLHAASQKVETRCTQTRMFLDLNPANRRPCNCDCRETCAARLSWAHQAMRRDTSYPLCHEWGCRQRHHVVT